MKRLGIGLVWAFSGVAAMAATQTFEVKAGDPDRTLTAAECKALIDSDDDLEKTGGGRLIISQAMTGYKGEIRVKAGYLRTTYPTNAIGDADKPLVVSSGATFEFGCPTAPLTFGKRKVQVSGTGADGNGALYHYDTVKSQWTTVFTNVELLDDTTFGGEPFKAGESCRRWDIRGNGTFDMNGHTLTLKGCSFGLAGTTVVNPGHIVGEGLSGLYFEGSANLNGTAENTITLGPGMLLSTQSHTGTCNWTLNLNGTKLQSQNWVADDNLTRCRLNGPFNVGEDGITVMGSTNKFWSLAGPISVAGEVYNNYGILRVLTGGDDTDGAAYSNYYQLAAHQRLAGDGANYLWPTNGSATAPLLEPADFPADSHTAIGGTGSYLLTGAQLGNASFYLKALSGGVMTITNASKAHDFGFLGVARGTLRMVDAGVVDVGTNLACVGALYPDPPARLVVGTNTQFKAWGISGDLSKGRTTINKVGPMPRPNGNTVIYGKSRGILEILPGAQVVTNSAYVGYGDGSAANATCQGSVFQSGGVHLMHANLAPAIGENAGGYYELSGGELQVPTWLFLGQREYGYGVFHLKGGKLSQSYNNAYLAFGQYSSKGGTFYQTGGSYSCWNEMFLGKSVYDTGNTGVHAQYTIAGGTCDVDSYIELGAEKNGTAYFNLNGGAVSAFLMQKPLNQMDTLVNGGTSVAYGENRAYVSFNGGRLDFRRNPSKMDGKGRVAYDAKSYFYGPIDRITVYEKGAFFSTGYAETYLNHTLTAPSGKGVVAVPFDTSKFKPWDYTGSPYVSIEGDGYGATAVAEFDSANGVVTGIVVTSPGNDYTYANAVIGYGGWTNKVTVACTLGEVAGGGLTKTGAGTLTINSTNTYAGATVVSNGTLTATDPDAYGASGEFEIGRAGILKISPKGAGLACGQQIGSTATVSYGYCTEEPKLDLGYATIDYQAGFYQQNHTVAYSGYVWNRAEESVDWTFAMCFDDSFALAIDGTNVAFTAQASGWGALNLATVKLTPGPHKFFLKLFNGPVPGGAVPSCNGGTGNWRTMEGFSYDPQGRGSKDAACYERMVDPGDGSLFSLSADDPLSAEESSSVPRQIAKLTIADGGVLDLNGGTLRFAGDFVAKAGGTGKVNGKLAFVPGSSIHVTGEVSEDGTRYSLATLAAGVEGLENVTLYVNGGAVDTANWRFSLKDGKLVLNRKRGGVILLR